MHKIQQRAGSKPFPTTSLAPIPENRAVSMDRNDNARIKVVVRIRPLNSKEVARGQQVIVQGTEQNVVIWDPVALDTAAVEGAGEQSCWAKTYSFDKVFWSLDPTDSKYSSQNDVFEELGQPVINWVLSGYNCCVLAYGQTGTGKTYTMSGNMGGEPSEYGLVPRICFGLFDDLESSAGEFDDATVTFSHMEIYNENVRDLLASPTSGYLRVREHPKHGVFVSNLTTVKVTNFEDVMSLIAIGERNRTVAATNSNLHSSRSHAIVTLTVILRTRNAPKNGLPTSALQQKAGRVHLVDLAGSERVTFSGAKGERLKEANHINLSLSVLGDVIKNLGDSKGRRGHIPYRNSTLTLVLKESLGGNSYAVMVTAISPSSLDYEETLSTLKYADRAKRVRMHVQANITQGLLATDSSAVDLVPLLQAEVRKLKEMLAAQQQQQQQQLEMFSMLNSGGGMMSHYLGPPTPSGRSLSSTAAPASGSLNVSWSAGEEYEQTNPSEVLREMRERVLELEGQLAERERLIESLEELHTEQQAAVADEREFAPSSPSSSGGYPNASITGGWDEPDHSNTSIGYVSLAPQISHSSHVHTPNHNAHWHHNHPHHSHRPHTIGKANSAAILGSPRATSELAPKSRPVVMLADDAVDTSLPRVINLNQDPLFSECLVYYLPEGSVVAGSKDVHADILLSGPDIIATHCTLSQSGGNVWLKPFPGALVFVNGDIVPPVDDHESPTSSPRSPRSHRPPATTSAGCLLRHFDRIAFGRFHLFRFEAAKGGKDEGTTSEQSSGMAVDVAPGWEFAQEELLGKNDALMSLRSPFGAVTPVIPTQKLGSLAYSSPVSGAAGRYSLVNKSSPLNSSPLLLAAKTTAIVSSPSPLPTKASTSVSRSQQSSSATSSAMLPKRSTSPTTVPQFLPVPPAHPAPVVSTGKVAKIDATFSTKSRAPSDISLKPTASKAKPSADSHEWWDRISRIAEGKEIVSPEEMSEMLAAMEITEEDIQREYQGSLLAGDPSVAENNKLGQSEQSANGLAAQSTKAPSRHNAQRPSTAAVVEEVNSASATSSIAAKDTNPPSKPAVKLPASSSTASTFNVPKISSGAVAPAVTTGVVATAGRDNATLFPHENFEREAKALQQELAQMQRTLEERMQRYQTLTSSSK